MTNRLKLTTWDGFYGNPLILSVYLYGSQAQSHAKTNVLSQENSLISRDRCCETIRGTKPKMFTGIPIDKFILDTLQKNHTKGKVCVEDIIEQYRESGQLKDDNTGLIKEKTVRKVFQNVLNAYRTDRGRDISVGVKDAVENGTIKSFRHIDGRVYHTFKY